MYESKEEDGRYEYREYEYQKAGRRYNAKKKAALFDIMLHFSGRRHFALVG